MIAFNPFDAVCSCQLACGAWGCVDFTRIITCAQILPAKGTARCLRVTFIVCLFAWLSPLCVGGHVWALPSCSAYEGSSSTLGLLAMWHRRRCVLQVAEHRAVLLDPWHTGCVSRMGIAFVSTPCQLTLTACRQTCQGLQLHPQE